MPHNPNKETSKKVPAQKDKELKRRHYLSLWADDPEVKAQMEVMAESEGRSLNNYFNTYVAPKIRGIIMTQLAEKPEYLRKALESELAAKGVKRQ